jgi:hypothetical protein
MRTLLQQVAQPQSDNTIFIYGLVDPQTGFVRYVGKTNNTRFRLNNHLAKDRLLADTPKVKWIESLLAQGVKPQIVILEEVIQSAWEEAEKRWIAFYQSKHDYPELTNSTSGGGGGMKPGTKLPQRTWMKRTVRSHTRVPHPVVIMPRPEVIQPSDQSIKLIPLTQGQVATVSSKWFEDFSKYNWNASWDKRAKTFYASRRIWTGEKSTTLLMHRVIAGDDYPHVDHWDGNGLNNTDENLRKCTASQNGGNRRLNSDNTSGYKGVYFSAQKQKYCSSITVNGKTFYLGVFVDPRDAARAYDRAAIKHFGEFARTNFSQSNYLS